MSLNTPSERTPLIDSIPQRLQEELAILGISHVSFGAGPGGMVGEQAGFTPPVSLELAMCWIEHYRSVLQRACLMDSAHNRHWFSTETYDRTDMATSSNQPPPVPHLEIVFEPNDEKPNKDLKQPSAVHPTLVQAYASTEFRVFEACPWALRVGEANARLPQFADPLMGVAFITAHNPFSQPLSDRENDQRHQSLLTRLKERGYRYVEGEGGDIDGEWPSERSVYIDGIDLIKASILGKEYGQNAIVWAGRDAVPRLIVLR